ncbi:ABC transporter permease [Paenibacillus sp. HJGM_3]|uniref:ABC transporter permease n=1 Tax=Paenibacillus sp. HJGM_3 TaxID=3379816 RepID=UPI00385FB0F5
MLNLIWNENMKIYRRLRSWLLVVSMIVITAVALLIVQNMTSSQTGSDWKVSVQQKIDQDNSRLGADIPSAHKEELQKDLRLNQYRLDHNVPPTDKTLWGNVLTGAHLLTIVTIFTVIVAADSVAGEFSSGTIKLLLIRPVSRSKVLLAKYVSTIGFSLFLFLILFASAVIVSGLLVGFQDAGTPYLYAAQDGGIHEVGMMYHALSTYGYQSVQLILIVTMAFMISTVFRSSSLSIAISIGIMFVGSAIANFITSYPWAKYYLFENTDLTVYLDGAPKIEGMTLSFSITVLVVHYLFFIASSWLVFNRRDVAS